MYTPLGPASAGPVLRQHALSSGGQRGHAEDRSVSFSSQASLARSVPPGATLHVSLPTCRVTEDARHVTRLRASKPRPHPGLAGTCCCCCELQDDTDPSLGFSVTGVSERGRRPVLGSKPYRKRVYRIRQPRILPRFGFVTQVAQKPWEGAAGEEETTRTKAAVSGAAGEVRRKRPAVHFVENIDSGQTSEREGESQQNQTSVSRGSGLNSSRNEGLKIKRERSADVEDVVAAGTTTATTAGGHRSSHALRQQAAQDERPVCRDDALPSCEDYIADGASRQRLVWKVDAVEVDAVYQQETEDQHQPLRRSLDGVTIPLDANIAPSDATGSDAKFPLRGEEAPEEDGGEVAEPLFSVLNSPVESSCTSDTSSWSSEDSDPSTLDALAKDCSTASWESRESGSTPETVICTPREYRQGSKLRQENGEACESERINREELKPAEHLRSEAGCEEKESCPGDISNTNAELSFNGGKKDVPTKMFGSETGMYSMGSTDPQSANASDATDKGVPPSLSGSASDDRRTKGELNPTAGEECGKVKHKAIYLKFFSSSVDCMKEIGEKKPASVKTKTFFSWTERSTEDKISACELLDRQKADSASNNDSEEDDHDQDDKDDGESEVKGTSAFQSVLLTGISAISDSGKIDRLVASDQCDLADQSGSKTLASSGSPAGEDRCKKGGVTGESLVHKKERGKIKLLPARVSKSYDINTESEPSRHHHRRRHHCSFSGLELPDESESDSSDASSSSSADSSVSAAHSFCSSDDERAANSQSQAGGQGDRHGSADRKTHGLVTCRRAGSKSPQSSPRRNSVAAPTRGVPQSRAGGSTDPSTAVPSGPPVPARRLVSVRRILAETDVSDNSVTLARATPEEMEAMAVQSGSARGQTEIAGNASSSPEVVWKPRASQRKSLVSEINPRSDVTAGRTGEEKLSTDSTSVSEVAELPATRPEDGVVEQAAAEDDTKASTASAVERDRQEGGKNESEKDVQGDRCEDAIANAAETEAKREEPVTMRHASVSVISYDGTAGSVLVSRSKEPGRSVRAGESPLTKDKGRMANSARRHFVFSDNSLTSSSSTASLDTAEVHDTVFVALRQCADDSQLKDDSQLTVVTPLTDPLGTSASTPLSSDKCAATETDSSELSPSATTTSGSDVTAMERESDISDAASGEEAYEPASLQGLSRFKRAQSVPPEKPPRKPQPPETQSPTARSASSMEVEKDRVYDVPPRRRSVKLPKDVCRPGSVQLLKSAFEQEDAVARHSAFRGTQPCSETAIPDDENPYANDNASHHRDSARTKARTSVRDRKISDASDSSVSGESEKSFQMRRSLFLQNDYVTSARVSQGKNKTPGLRRQESGEQAKASSKVTDNTRAPNSDKQQGKMEEPVVYANSSAVAWFQAGAQRDRERRSSLQKDLSLESSTTLAELASSKAKVWRTRGFRMSSSSFDSERYEASPKLIFRREGGEGSQGKNRGARAASVASQDAGSRDSGETRVAESVSSRANSKDGTSGHSGVAGASDEMAVAALADATTAGSGMCGKEEDEARTATQEGSGLAEGEKARRENSLEKQNENSAAVEGKLVKNGNSHTAWHHFSSQDNDGYEDVSPGSQTVHQGPNTPAVTTAAGVVGVAAKGGSESPPVPERNYALRQNKYNEYTNIVRVDSEKLRNARAKSSSTHALFQVTDNDSASAAPMRKTVSLEGGLDTKGKKRRKAKDHRQPEEKRKTNFSFQKLMSLFRKKRKKQRTEAKTGDEEAETSAEEAAGGKVPENFFSVRKILRKMKPKAERAAAGSSAHGANDGRPIGRLLRLNADGTQLVELIRSQGESLGIVLTKGSDEDEDGVFVSGFTDSTAQKFLSGILSVGDEIVKVNDRLVATSSIDSVHNMIMGHLRVKLVTVPVRCE